VTIIAVLTFCGAAVLALSSFGFFLIAVMGTTSKDGGQPVSAAIDGMGVAGGFSLLVLASVAACLAIGVLKLREWAWIVSMACIAAGIGCTIFSIFAFWSYRLIPVVAIIVFHLLVMGTGIWMLAYLARPNVKQAFRAVTT
jgi:hypothetical protein